MRWAGALWLVVAVSGCSDPAPARDQWLVTVATNAPLPQFGDRLLIEVVGEDGALACDSCRRIVGITPSDLPLSFGIAATKQTARVRARLYRADSTGPDGFPRGEALIDAMGALPPADGSTPVTAKLLMRCFGVPAQPSERLACRPEDGLLAPLETWRHESDLPMTGSWSVESAPCPQVGASEVCVPGGAFLLGSLDHAGIAAELAPSPEHLTAVSTFVLARDEFTVGQLRQVLLAGAPVPPPLLQSPDPKAPAAGCTFVGVDDPGNDALPVNCISHAAAAAACAALGARLPSEAEWEYAAGQRHLETPYPWGHADDVCDYAVVATGRFSAAYEPEPSTCRITDDGSLLPWGPRPGGNPRDVTSEGVENLGGNLAEWVADSFASYTAPCWQADGTIRYDPLCAGDPPWVYRGSGWIGFPAQARAYSRSRESLPSTNIGFRCARSVPSP